MMATETDYTTHVLPSETVTGDLPPKAYLAGPMRGIKDYNFPLFHASARHLRNHHGWEVISPAEIDLELGFDPETSPFTLEDWYEAMRRDITILMDPSVDRIVFLPGWEGSRGANVERVVAEAVGMEVWYLYPSADEACMPVLSMFYMP